MGKIIKKVTLNAPASTSTGTDPTKGTEENPYTKEEYDELCRLGLWGHSTTNPQQGDLGIIPDSHVGIFVRMEGDYAILISGNYSNKVMEHVVNRQFLVFRTQ